MAVASRTLSLEQFLDLPEETPELEYIDGEVEQKMSPRGRHSVLQLEFARQIEGHARPRSLARAFPELRTTFGGESRVPDVAVYRWDRIPRDAMGRVADAFLTAPDITIEILSPGQSLGALVRRCLWYVANEVGLALAVDPDDETVIACHPDGRVEVWHGADRIDLGELLSELELTAEELFSCLR